MATAHRLEADLKERDLMNARAELVADEEDFVDIERRLAGEREIIQDLERRHAEAGAALRAAQHALKLENRRRANAEEALDEATILADQRRLALTTLRSENDGLRLRLGDEPGAPVPFEIDDAKLPRAITHAAEEEEELGEEDEVLPIHTGGSVVPLPTRVRQMAAESPEQSEAVVAEAARDLHRIADEANREESKEQRRAAPRMPAAPAASIGELVALRLAPSNDDADPKAKPAAEGKVTPESRFFEALAEIRALKRAANQAGE
jgi:hypothetical protein